ncbi:MAG: ABC transporter substrate-binding protein [Bacteroidota bacterium]
MSHPLLAATLLVVLVGCSTEQGPRDVSDDAGRAIALAETPQSVVALAPNLTELVVEAAGVERLAGASIADDYPAEVEGLPRFQSYPLDRERLVALGPDLVLGTMGVTSPQDLDALADLGLPAYAFEFDALDDVPRALRTLDTLLASDGGHPAAETFEARVAAVRQRTAGRSPRRTLLLIGVDNGTLFAFGRDAYASEVVRLAGGTNVTDRFPGDAAQPSAEQILSEPPEVILVAGSGDVRDQLLDAVPALAALQAVQEGRVYAVEPDHILRPGPRTVLALEAIARILHPEAFAAGAA